MQDIRHHKKLIFLIVLLPIIGFLMRDQALGQEEQKKDETKKFKFDPRRPPEADLEMSIEGGFTLAAVGDCIIARPHSQIRDPRFQALLKILREADAAFGNCETSFFNIRGFKGYPQAETGGWYLVGAPATAKDLKKMGFDLLSRANNHTLDWGVEGMRETSRLLDEAGLVHAGSGEHRGEARAPRYLESERGRIGLVSMAATFTPLSQSMPPWGQAPGRPGINAIKTTRYNLVSQDTMKALRKIKDKIKEARKKRNIETTGAPHPPREEEEKKKDELTLFRTKFRLSDRIGYSYEMDPIDFQENLKSVRQGKQYSDFLIATLHAHQGDLGRDDIADFQQKLAHAAIDAGADAFIGHGVHRLRPIEIYKGKPIFYSLSDFFWDDKQEPYAADYFERYRKDLITAYGDPQKATDGDLTAVLNSKSWGSKEEDNLVFHSVIAVSRYEKSQASEIKLYPVDLGYGKRLTESGIPRVPSPEVAMRILERLKKMSKPFGTEISIEENIGIIRVPMTKKNPTK